MSTPLSPNRIQAWLPTFAPHATLRQIHPLKGGISSSVVRADIAHADGRAQTIVLRAPSAWARSRDPDAAAHEAARLRLVAAHGLPVPIPLRLEAADDHFATATLVLPYLNGAPRFDQAAAPTLIPPMAARLAALHRIPPILGADCFIAFSPPKLLTAADFTHAEEADLHARIHAILAPVWPHLLAEPPALLHGDFWPGNLLWQGDHLAAILDWEDALLGSPLHDLAISRLDILWCFGPTAMRDFTQRYLAHNPLDTATLPYWDLVAALRPLDGFSAWAATWPDWGRPDITAAAMRAAHRAFIEQALAALPVGFLRA
jgi:aminoglycoside phosphotransferase (APT) family kinase protein